MPDNSVAHQHHATFEGIRHVDDEGNEFWLARPLGKVLDYSEYRHFLPVVERAREACRNSGHPVEDHFEDILEMVEIGSGAKQELADNAKFAQLSEDEKHPAIRNKLTTHNKHLALAAKNADVETSLNDAIHRPTICQICINQ